MHQLQFLRGDRLGLWRQIDSRFEAIIFDEFHLYQPAQVSGVLNTLFLMRSVGIKHKYIFLSATPHLHLVKCLELARLNYRAIAPAHNNGYSSSGGVGWRQILQPTQLDLIKADRGSGRIYAENWIAEHEQLIWDFFEQYPGSRGAIVLDSIAAVKRTRARLSALLKPLGLTVSENTGFTDQDQVATAVQADVVVGTLTLDVGIDFRINFLIFEGHDAPTFLQRLGRLGRHPGFPIYQAYALVPSAVVARIAMALTGEWDAQVWQGEHLTFNQAVVANHRQVNTFAQYFKCWSPVQAIVIGQQLLHKDLEGKYKSACEQLYGADFKDVRQQYLRWKQEAELLQTRNLIVAEAHSFRGTSKLQCAILDCSTPGRQTLKTYNLPGILSNYIFEFADREQFIAAATNRSTELPSWVGHCHFCFKVFELEQKRQRW